MHIRDIIEHYLNPEDSEKFANWVLDDELNVPKDVMDAIFTKWIEKHSELLLLDPTGNPTEDIPKMIEIWKQFNENKPS